MCFSIVRDQQRIEDRRMDWNARPTSRWGLRQLGIFLLFGAYSAGTHVVSIMHASVGNPPPLAYLLALGAFLSVSSGMALMLYGHHLFGKVVIAKRWRSRPPVAVCHVEEPDAVASASARPHRVDGTTLTTAAKASVGRGQDRTVRP
jgi:hypothetical protein